ncbi:MAG: sulfotransferase, partial [Bacteroidota bacterium]
QYLLSQDDRFGYLTYYQAFIPNLSILGGKWLKRRVAPFIPAKRPQDDVHLHVDLPTEEENPIATFGTTSASHSWFWPTNESYHQRYAIFKGIRQADHLRWRKNYRRMLRRISINWPGRQLLIKNPHNTGRIPELLELYPNARFIYLHRDPQEVYPSTRLMYDRVILTQYLEPYPVSETTDKIFKYAHDILDRYMSTSRQVRPSHLIEIDYTHLVKDPKEVIAQIYGHFDYHLNNTTLDRITTYLSERSDYRVNRHVNDAALSLRIQKSWPEFELNKNDV